MLVVFERSSPDARAVLRECWVSYAAADGELFGVRSAGVCGACGDAAGCAGRRVPAAPFAARASRVPRWLLLHGEERFSLREASLASCS